MEPTSSPAKTAKELFTARHQRLASLMEEAGFPALVLNPGPTLTYLTGLHFHLMERPVVLIFTPHQAPVLVLPELEMAKVEDLSFPLQAIPYSEDPALWPAAFRTAAQRAEIDSVNVGVEPQRLRVLELRLLESVAPRARYLTFEDPLARLRQVKDAQELEAMRRAVGIAQDALQAVLPSIRPGMTEKELAAGLTLQLLHAGSDGEFPFAPIVSGGPNSANPHAVPSERPLAAGDLLVIDWGAAYGGYISDLTRTFAVREVEAEFRKIASLVEEANAAGRAAARPGVTAGAVDQAARAVIESAGYGQYFIHRTGHGIGMEAHEGPYIRQGNLLVLEPGMTFTIEPGIYLPGRGGVRIEDNVAITESGAETLSNLPRELIVTGGR